jgi:hypothetical protein
VLGLGTSSIATHTRLWHPTDVSGLEMWLIAREEYLTLEGTAIDNWKAKYGDYNYAQPDNDNRRPAWDAANQKLTFAISPNPDYLAEADDAIVLDTSATGWTIAIYCASTDWDASTDQVFMGDSSGNNDFFFLDASTNDIAIKADGQTKTISLDTPSSLTDDQFYHIMATVQTNGDFVLYVDNVAQSDTESFSDTKDFEIDQISGKNTTNRTFNGDIKSIMVFREPLGTEDRTGCYEHMTQEDKGI